MTEIYIPQERRPHVAIERKGNVVTFFFPADVPNLREGYAAPLDAIQLFMRKNGFTPRQGSDVHNVLTEQLINRNEHTLDVLEVRKHSGVMVRFDMATRNCQVKSFGFVNAAGRQRLQQKYDEAMALSRAEASEAESKNFDTPEINLSGRSTSGSGLMSQRADAEGTMTLTFSGEQDGFYKDDGGNPIRDAQGHPLDLSPFQFTVEALKGNAPAPQPPAAKKHRIDGEVAEAAEGLSEVTHDETPVGNGGVDRSGEHRKGPPRRERHQKKTVKHGRR